jgi:hypothetical protein
MQVADPRRDDTEIDSLGSHRNEQVGLREAEVLEPFSIVEVFVTTCGSLVSKKGLATDDRDNTTVNIGMDRIADRFVE